MSTEQIQKEKKKKVSFKKEPPRRRRCHAGTVALREIRRYQKSTAHLIPRSPFKRLCYEVLDKVQHERWRYYSTKENDATLFTKEAIDVLWEASEDHLVRVFKQTNLLAIARESITVEPRDIGIARELRKIDLYG